MKKLKNRTCFTLLITYFNFQNEKINHQYCKNHKAKMMCRNSLIFGQGGNDCKGGGFYYVKDKDFATSPVINGICFPELLLVLACRDPA